MRKRAGEQKAEKTGRGEKSLRTKKTYESKDKGHFRSFLKIWKMGKIKPSGALYRR